MEKINSTSNDDFSSKLVSFCWDRVINQYKDAWSKYSPLYKSQSENIIFLMSYLYTLITRNNNSSSNSSTSSSTSSSSSSNSNDSATRLMKMTQDVEEMCSLWLQKPPTQGFPCQFMFVRSQILGHPSEKIIIKESTKEEEFSAISFQDKMITLVNSKKWKESTFYFTNTWIQVLAQGTKEEQESHCRSIHETAYVILLQLAKLQIPLKIVKSGKNIHCLTPQSEYLVYLFTHILFVLTKWNSVALLDTKQISTSTNEEMMLIFKHCAWNWFQELSSNSQILKYNREVVLELGVSLMILYAAAPEVAAAATAGSCCFLTEQQKMDVFRELEFLMHDIQVSSNHMIDNTYGFSIYPSDNPKTNGQLYREHVDYHTHFLVAFYVVSYQKFTIQHVNRDDQQQQQLLLRYIGGLKMKTIPMKDSTHLYLSGNYNGLQTQLHHDGYIFIRGALAKQSVQINELFENIVNHISNKDCSKGGWLVEAHDGYVHDERESAAHFESWCKLLSGQNARSVYYAEDSELQKFLRQTLGTVLSLVDQTWFRIKMPGESSKIHADYGHFLSSGNMFSKHADFLDCSKPNTNVNACALCQKPCSVKIQKYQKEWHCVECSNSDLPGWTCWIPLHNLESESGPLCVLPGSHKWNCFEEFDSKFVLPARLTSDSKILQEQTWVYPQSMNTGDIILFNIKLIHASMPNNTRKLRLSCDTRMLTKKSNNIMNEN
jgi:hypothetical protein